MNLNLTLIGVLLMSLSLSGAAADLTVGQPAPDFSLKDQNDQAHGLVDYQGQWLVLYFYPKDDTPGCTTEACNFRDDIMQLQALGAQVLGVSTDTTHSHAKFAAKYQLPYPLLADAKGEVAARYGASGGIGPLRFAKRHSFIIDPAGKIAKVYRDVQPKRHSDEVIADLKQLQEATP